MQRQQIQDPQHTTLGPTHQRTELETETRLQSIERRITAIEQRYSFDSGTISSVREYIEQWLQEHEYVAVAQIRWELSYLYPESAVRQAIHLMHRQHKLLKVSVGVYKRL